LLFHTFTTFSEAVNSPHDNGLMVSNVTEWNHKKLDALDVIKFGGKTGFRTGKFLQTKETHEQYKNVLEIAIDNNVQLVNPEGDSGSIYYTKSNDSECYIPIGIHRSSNKKDRMFATPFFESFMEILDKRGMNIDAFRACNRYVNSNGIQGCGNSHTTKRTF
jgi:hypothetical protein